MNETELSVMSPGTVLTVYDRVDPMEFVEKMGKVYAMSGAGGCQTESDGKLMALACLCERKSIFDIARRYHLMGGKLVLKAETMLGDFRRAGGTHRWINDGDDGVEAILELTDSKGNVSVTPFTFAKAVAAGYVKKGSQWEKRPDQMLRSRCITDGIRKLCPEISSGEFVAEEADDFEDTRPVRSAATVSSAKSTTVAKTTSVAASTATVEPVIDATHEPATKTTEPAPFDIGSGPAGPTGAGDVAPMDPTTVLLEIEATIQQAGVTIERVLTAINTKGGTAFKTLDELPAEKSLVLLENLRAIVAKQQNPTVPI